MPPWENCASCRLLRYGAKKELPGLLVQFGKVKIAVVEGPDIAETLDHAEEEQGGRMQIHFLPDLSGNNALGEEFFQGVDIIINNLCYFFIQLPVAQGNNFRDDPEGKSSTLFYSRKVVFHC